MQVDNGGGVGTFGTGLPSPVSPRRKEERKVGVKENTKKKSEISVCPRHPCGPGGGRGGCFCLAADWSAAAQAAVFPQAPSRWATMLILNAALSLKSRSA